MVLRARRRRGRFAPPPPTPEGMVWETDGSELVSADRFALESKREMLLHDRLSPEDRRDAAITGLPAQFYLDRKRRAAFDFGF